jgi:integrase
MNGRKILKVDKNPNWPKGVRYKTSKNKGYSYTRFVYDNRKGLYKTLKSDPSDIEGIKWEIAQLYKSRGLQMKNPKDPVLRPVKNGSLGWLAEKYFADKKSDLTAYSLGKKQALFNQLYSDLQIEIRRKEWISIADYPFEKITGEHVHEAMRLKKIQGLPVAANARRRIFSELYNWAMILYNPGNNPTDPKRKIHSNPVLGVPKVRGMAIQHIAKCRCCSTHHTWTEDEMTLWEDHYPLGTKARLWFDLQQYTGLRISDVTRLGPRMVNNGCFEFVETKNREKNIRENKPEKFRQIPILPELKKSIDKTIIGTQTFLVNEQGASYGRNGLNKRIREWRRDIPGMPEYCSSHGIRKAACCRLLLTGLDEKIVADIFGWSDVGEMLRLYGEQAIRTLKNKRVVEHLHLIGTKR